MPRLSSDTTALLDILMPGLPSDVTHHHLSLVVLVPQIMLAGLFG